MISISLFRLLGKAGIGTFSGLFEFADLRLKLLQACLYGRNKFNDGLLALLEIRLGAGLMNL